MLKFLENVRANVLKYELPAGQKVKDQQCRINEKRKVFGGL